jgi:hypothetical protein
VIAKIKLTPNELKLSTLYLKGLSPLSVHMPQHLLSLRPTYHPLSALTICVTYHPLSALTICVSSLFLSPNPTPPHPTTTSLRSPRRSSALAPPTPSMSRQLIEQYDFHPIPETARMEPASVLAR